METQPLRGSASISAEQSCPGNSAFSISIFIKTHTTIFCLLLLPQLLWLPGYSCSPFSFCFLLLSDIPVGSPNGRSAWGDACLVSRARLQAVPPPVPRTHHCCGRWHRAPGTEGQPSWHGSTAQPNQKEGKDHGEEGGRSVQEWPNTHAGYVPRWAHLTARLSTTLPQTPSTPQQPLWQDFPVRMSLWRRRSWGAPFRAAFPATASAMCVLISL